MKKNSFIQAEFFMLSWWYQYADFAHLPLHAVVFGKMSWFLSSLLHPEAWFIFKQ